VLRWTAEIGGMGGTEHYLRNRLDAPTGVRMTRMRHHTGKAVSETRRDGQQQLILRCDAPSSLTGIDLDQSARGVVMRRDHRRHVEIIRSTRAGESPWASLRLPATFTSSRSVSSSSRIGASV